MKFSRSASLILLALLCVVLVVQRGVGPTPSGSTLPHDTAENPSSTTPSSILSQTPPPPDFSAASQEVSSTVPAIQAFHEWTARYVAADDFATRVALENEGVKLARARQTAMADLVIHHPEQAFAAALDYGIRKQMPAEVQSLLEQPINATGDLTVLGVLADPNAIDELPPMLRTATIQGEEYQVFTYGAGERYPTRKGVALNGLVLPNDAASSPFSTVFGTPRFVMALHPDPARRLSLEESAELIQSRQIASEPDPICVESGKPVSWQEEETVVELGGNLHSFCGKVDAELWIKARVAAMGLAAGEDVGDPTSLDTAASSYTEGRKRMFLMRPYWSDFAPVMSTNQALSHWQSFSNYMHELSYGKLTFAPLGQGSDISADLLLPGKVAEYDNTGLGKLYNTCRDVAQNTYGYDLSQYDFLYVVTGSKPAAGYCGLAFVGGVGFHIPCWGADVSAHEFGHNLGLNHAHFWDTKSQSIIGDGQNVEYGDSNDPMGGGGSPNHYNSRYKNYLGWIKDSDIVDLNTRGSGTYRLYSFDLDSSSGVRGLKFRRNASQNYWVQFRQRKTDKRAIMNGVQLLWTGNGNEGSYLLDVRLRGSADDSALVIGRTFSDTNVGLHITPVGKGHTDPESMDVVVQIGKFPSNRSPVARVVASAAAVPVGQSVRFTALASDPDGDALAYSWNFSDGEYSVSNEDTISRVFTTAGEYSVQCVVSDMKGGTSRQTVVVRVGTPATHRISGIVLDASNRPVAGAKVSVTADRFAFTDSDGRYTLVGLAAGNYTVSVIEPVAGALSFIHPYFENPIAVGPSFEGADFIGIRGSLNINTPVIAKNATGWKYLDNGSDQGTAWSQPGFADAAWKTGKAPLGYGQGGEGTVLSFGANAADKFVTAYLRRTFTVSNPSAFTNFVLEVLRDDGVIVYLNGEPVFRNNIAANPGYRTYATDSVEPDSYLSTVIPSALINAGVNTLAAEVHQSTPNSSDLFFDAAISGVSVSNVAGLNLAYLSHPADRSLIAPNTSVPLSAMVKSAIPVNKVTFYADGSLLSEDTVAPWEGTWAGAASGEHELSFVASIGSLSVTSPTVRVLISSTDTGPVDQDLTLVAAGSRWRYLSAAAAPPAGWHSSTFNDSAWLSGRAKLGFGRGDEVTTINGGPSSARYPAVYFRQAFLVNDPAGIKELFLRMKRDDGAVVYLNGEEVARDGLPPGPVRHADLASSSDDNGANFIPQNLSPLALSYLTPGTNVIAVEMHQSSLTSSDLALDLELRAVAFTNRSRGCWIVSPGDSTSGNFPGGLTVEVEAVAGGTLGVDHVDFLVNGVQLASDNRAPFRWTWESPTSDIQQIQAVAFDTAGQPIFSEPITVLVEPPPAPLDLVNWGAYWRYLDTGADPGSKWATAGFNDRDWRVGGAPLGHGNQSQTIATQLRATDPSGNGVVTRYFRRSMVRAAAESIPKALLSFRAADGLVVYWNGQEIHRFNMPESQISPNSLALRPSASLAGDELQSVLLEDLALQSGTNVIAVELHQSSRTRTSSYFDLQFEALREPPSNVDVYLTSPGEGAQYNASAAISLEAHPSDPTETQRVEFWVDGAKKAEVAEVPFRYVWTGGSLGEHVVVAQLIKKTGATVASLPVVFRVNPDPFDVSPTSVVSIPAGSSWRFWDQEQVPGSGWGTLGFDDSSWPSGRARFGYGLDGEITSLTSGRWVHYFRRTFTVDNPASYSEVLLRLIRDDGAVVYLNGREIYRSNMPGGIINATTPASGSVETPEETSWIETVLPVNGLGLRPGANVIAVELHQASQTSSDAGFDLQWNVIGTTERRVNISQPTAASLVPLGSPAPLAATAQSGNGSPLERIEFWIDGVRVADALPPSLQATWQNPTLGDHTIVARAVFRDGGVVDSTSVRAVVAPEPAHITYLAADAVWKYLDTGVNLGTGWRAPTFDDLAWASGPARLGYGEDGEATTVSFGPDPNNKFITTYFRAEFTGTDQAVITNVTCRYLRDDGIAIYLNGKELLRNNLAAGAGYRVTAIEQVNGAAEQTWLSQDVGVTNIVVGRNVVAVEIHQASAASSDMGFALELIGNGYFKPSTEVPPTLQYRLLADGRIEISWPSAAAGYTVLSTPDLKEQGTVWAPWSESPTAVGASQVLWIVPDGANRFFRLSK